MLKHSKNNYPKPRIWERTFRFHLLWKLQIYVYIADSFTVIKRKYFLLFQSKMETILSDHWKDVDRLDMYNLNAFQSDLLKRYFNCS